jgi:hypothetical protein
MFDFFDQPWTLLITAAIALRVIYIIFTDIGRWWQWLILVLTIVVLILMDLFVSIDILRINKPIHIIINTILILTTFVMFALPVIEALSMKIKRWQLTLIPLFIAAVAFGCDVFVRTDLEKINTVVQTVIVAVEKENPDSIDRVISPDYSDSLHHTREPLIRYCRRLLAKPLVEKNKKIALTIDMESPKATATLVAMTRMDQASKFYSQYSVPVLNTKVRFDLRKYSDGRWMIVSAQILEVNRQSMTWNQIDSHTRRFTEP